MIATISSFSSLYFATLLMLIGTGLFNTYMGLRLTSQAVSEVWIGALIAGYYFGLVCGARLGHRLIIRVGHIRAFVACAAVATSMILAQTLVDSLPLWLAFRVISGIVMVTEFMVIESWLNEQTENHQRGRVFSVYMVVSGLGTVLGQLALTAYATLDLRPLTLVAMCLVLCLVPIAVTARSHPPTPLPAPLDIRFFLRRVPLSMTVLFVAGNVRRVLRPGRCLRGQARHEHVPGGGVRRHGGDRRPAVPMADGLAVGPHQPRRADPLQCLAAGGPAGADVGWIELPFWAMLALSAVFGVLHHAVPAGRGLRQRPCGIRAARQPVGGAADDLRRRRLRRPHDRGRADVLGRAQHVLHVRIGLLADPGLAGAADARHGRAPGAEAPTHFVPMPDTLQSSPASAVLDPGSIPRPTSRSRWWSRIPPRPPCSLSTLSPPRLWWRVRRQPLRRLRARRSQRRRQIIPPPPRPRDMGYEAGRVPDAKDLDEAPEPRLRTGT